MPPVACVVGANGFIGRAAVRALLEAGFDVRAAVRDAQGAPDEWRGEPKVTVIDGVDVRYRESLDRCGFDTARVVVNCAGLYKWYVRETQEYYAVNADGAQNVAAACAWAGNPPLLIHISTAMAYGYPREAPFTEASPPGPHAAEYPRSKAAGDALVRKACPEAVILYLGCVTGAGGDDCASVGRPGNVYTQFLKGQIPMLVAPDTRYIYVAVGDVGRAVAAAALRGREVQGQAFLIGNSRDPVTTRRLFAMMAAASGRRAPTWALPLWLAGGLAWVETVAARYVTGHPPMLPADIVRTARWGAIAYDCSKSEAALGLSYTPVQAAVEAGMEEAARGLEHRGA